VWSLLKILSVPLPPPFKKNLNDKILCHSVSKGLFFFFLHTTGHPVIDGILVKLNVYGLAHESFLKLGFTNY